MDEDRHRPMSLYDNYLQGNCYNATTVPLIAAANDVQIAVFNNNRGEDDAKKSLRYSLSTTVPQSIVKNDIGGKHVPTRNSLRHSRMIVMNRAALKESNFNGFLFAFGEIKKARRLTITQILLGVTILTLSVFMEIWTPNLSAKDHPYWSGLPVVISGTFGLFVIGCCRKRKYNFNHTTYLNILKTTNLIVAVIAAVVCVTACILAANHLTILSQMQCGPQTINSTCYCHMTLDESRNFTGQMWNKWLLTAVPLPYVNVSANQVTIHYVDLNCPEVNNVLTALLSFSGLINALSGCVFFYFIYFILTNKHVYYYYDRTSNV